MRRCAASRTPDKPNGFFDATVNGGWVVPGEPYVVQQERRTRGWRRGAEPHEDDQNFMWWRARMLGGRTNHWGRVSLRMGPRDFKPRSTDGLGFDWPIDYEDVAPYYDKVDELIGLFGSEEGMPNDPGQRILPAAAEAARLRAAAPARRERSSASR